MNIPLDKKVGKVARVQAKYTWHIENLLQYSQLPEIVSPTFTMKSGNDITKWSLFMEGDKKESENSKNTEEYIGIHLRSLNKEDVRVTVEFCLLSVYNKEICRRRVEDAEFKQGEGWGNKKFITRKQLFSESRQSCTIACTITTSEFIKFETEKYNDSAVQSSRLAEFDKFGDLLYDGKLSDVVIDVEGEEINVHKIFLATKSPVFEAMFTHNMSESNNNRLEMSDISYETVMGMLKFIYTGNVPDYSSNPLSDSLYKDLLIVAEKYDLANLKFECQKKLSSYLKAHNVFEYLNFSCTHNALFLKQKVIEYIVDHGEDIAALPSFNTDCNELNSHIYSEVFRALVTKRRKVE